MASLVQCLSEKIWIIVKTNFFVVTSSSLVFPKVSFVEQNFQFLFIDILIQGFFELRSLDSTNKWHKMDIFTAGLVWGFHLHISTMNIWVVVGKKSGRESLQVTKTHLTI